jgi:hypothetical protein
VEILLQQPRLNQGYNGIGFSFSHSYMFSALAAQTDYKPVVATTDSYFAKAFLKEEDQYSQDDNRQDKC